MATGNKNVDGIIKLIYNVAHAADIDSLRDEQSIQLAELLSSNGSSSSKIYKATLTQTGTNAPVATVLENTLGVTITWTRDGAGSYIGTASAPIFTSAENTLFTSGQNYNLAGAEITYIYYGSNTEVYIETIDDGATGGNVDNSLIQTAIIIEVF